MYKNVDEISEFQDIGLHIQTWAKTWSRVLREELRCIINVSRKLLNHLEPSSKYVQPASIINKSSFSFYGFLMFLNVNNDYFLK
jgi:hypothetical protein